MLLKNVNDGDLIIESFVFKIVLKYGRYNGGSYSLYLYCIVLNGLVNFVYSFE